jgi:hypothetical protein
MGTDPRAAARADIANRVLLLSAVLLEFMGSGRIAVAVVLTIRHRSSLLIRWLAVPTTTRIGHRPCS